MRIFRRLAISLSLYSRIPMPQFEWKDEDVKYAIAFLPVTGILIGLVLFGIHTALSGYEKIADAFPLIFKMCVYLLIPLVITGGFHLDGFLDVQDAFKSYKSREEKLQILKDPHIGAFAIINLCILGLVEMMGMSLLAKTNDYNQFGVYCLSFVLSRALAGLTSIFMKHAKKDGMLNQETQNADGKVSTILILFLILTIVCMYCLNWKLATANLIVTGIFTIFYKSKCYREFGGVTGDTAGYYVVMCQAVMLFVTGAGVFLL